MNLSIFVILHIYLYMSKLQKFLDKFFACDVLRIPRHQLIDLEMQMNLNALDVTRLGLAKL